MPRLRTNTAGISIYGTYPAKMLLGSSSTVELLKPERGTCVRGKGWILLLAIYLSAGCVFAIDLGEKVSIHGFASQGYAISDKYNFQTLNSKGDGTYQFNEFGINLNIDASSKLRGGIQLLTREYGYIGDTKPTIDWAQIDYRFFDQLGVRAGRIKLPLGLYNESRDIDLARTCILLPQSIYSEILRDTIKTLDGIQLYGYFSLASLGDIEYKILAGYSDVEPDNSGTPIVFSDGNFMFDPQRAEAEADLSYSGSFSWMPPLDGLRLMLSFSEFNSGLKQSDFSGVLNTSDYGFPYSIWIPYIAEEMSGTTKGYTWYTLSAEYLVGDLTLVAEATYRYGVARIDAKNIDIGQPKPIEANSLEFDIKEVGGYIGASYRFSEWFELGLYYSAYDIKDEDNSQDIALSARFDVTENWLFKIEGHYLNGNSNIAGPQKAAAYGADWTMFNLKTTFNF